MFKGTIKLKDGSVAEIECSTASELGEVLGSISASQMTEIHLPASNSYKLTDIGKQGKRQVRHKVRTQGKEDRWNEDEIVLMAKGIMEAAQNGNLRTHSYKRAKFQEILTTLQTFWDKNGLIPRSPASVYVAFGRTLRYLATGSKSGGMSKSVTKALKANGYFPKSLKHAGLQFRFGRGNNNKGTKASTQVKGKKPRVLIAWPDQDVLALARIVKDSLDKNVSPNSAVREYMATRSNGPKRGKTSVHSMIVRLKRYYANDYGNKQPDKRVINLLGDVNQNKEGVSSEQGLLIPEEA